MFLYNQLNSRIKQIYKLDKNDTVPSVFYNIKEFTFHLKEYWVSDNYFYLYSVSDCLLNRCTPVPPNPTKILVYDTDFKLVNVIVDELFNFDISTQANTDFLIKRDFSDALIALEQGVKGLRVNDITIQIIDVLGDSENGVYVFALDKLTQTTGIYKASNQLNVSPQLDGLWTSSEWSSQGLSIHAGKRPDKSEYLFASLYIYKNGFPFWVAGNRELNTGKESLSMELYDYQGKSFLSKALHRLGELKKDASSNLTCCIIRFLITI